MCPHKNIPPGGKYPKFLTTLYPKTNYVIHYTNLKKALGCGVKLKAVHRILKFYQSPWLKQYIDLNTYLRIIAANDFKKNFYKLMNNSVYGNCLENVRHHKDVKLVTKWEGRYVARALIAQPNFHSLTIFDEDIAIIEMERRKVNTPAPPSCSKNRACFKDLCIHLYFNILLYDFHYDYKRELGNRAKLLYTDTDSPIYQIYDIDI
ncbi:hypothetical protein NQ315_012804 [Exocentrus adspersus]|uniref:DNA-directed DNA polymerase n=1 Tax=Exocentrus adspersus TaxID=1586481 RepID=A0AAV8VBA0_9CUCU|nr:hypothetical protein NQ315_012804 [Exocentrus adspersus]